MTSSVFRLRLWQHFTMSPLVYSYITGRFDGFLSLHSVAVISTMTKSNLGGKKGLFQLTIYSWSGRRRQTGSQGRNPRGNGGMLLSGSLLTRLLSLLCYTPQDNPQWTGPPISIISRGNAQWSYLQICLLGSFSHLRFLLRWLYFVLSWKSNQLIGYP